MKILFTSDCNGHEYKDPFAWLVELDKFMNLQDIRVYEFNQVGVNRRGGDISELLQELKLNQINSTVLKEGRKSSIKKPWQYWHYPLISGNY